MTAASAKPPARRRSDGRGPTTGKLRTIDGVPPVTRPGPVSDRQFQIGEVAERCGLSLRTVRYYEEQGLIEPASRTDGGFRLYTDQQVDRLDLIKQMKPLGFTMAEMRELLDAHDTLEDPEVGAAALTVAREQVIAYATAASARCDALREELGRAEQFAKALRRATRSTKPTSTRD